MEPPLLGEVGGKTEVAVTGLKGVFAKRGNNILGIEDIVLSGVHPYDEGEIGNTRE